MTEKLTLAQKSEIESLLLQQKAEYQAMETHGTFASGARFEPADARRNNSYERASDAKLDADLHLENHYLAILAKIDRNLERLEDDSYGNCIDCGAPIGYQRLQAFPMAERCIACKSEYEKTHSE